MSTSISHAAESIPKAQSSLGRFLSIGELSTAQVVELLDRSRECADPSRQPERVLQGQTVASIFDKPSTRTRVSIAGAVARLGGQCQVLRPDELQLGRGETIEDTARVLSSFVAAITIRTFEHDTVVRLAAASSVPVINALTDEHHPLQALADAMTLQQEFGTDLTGMHVAWIGDGNNVAHSWMEVCAHLGVSITLATPGTRPLDEAIVRRAREIARTSGSVVELTTDARDAAVGAHAIYTDVWSSMGDETDALQLAKLLEPYRVDSSIMELAHDDAIFMHCLPAHREQEVTAEVIDGPQSRVFPQAANRMPTAQAAIATLVGR